MAKCKAKGGAIDGGRGTKEEDKEVDEKKGAFKKGGRVKKKHGGKVGGKHPGMRPDKKARGGKADMQSTPGIKNKGGSGSPLSGAGSTAEPSKPMNDKEDD